MASLDLDCSSSLSGPRGAAVRVVKVRGLVASSSREDSDSLGIEEGPSALSMGFVKEDSLASSGGVVTEGSQLSSSGTGSETIDGSEESHLWDPWEQLERSLKESTPPRIMFSGGDIQDTLIFT